LVARSFSSSRDAFAVDLIRREVLSRNRRALILYGAGHFFRKVVSQSIVTLLEAEHLKIFTIWTNAAAEMTTMQPSVAGWPVPSMTRVRGIVHGHGRALKPHFQNACGASPSSGRHLPTA
jgi:hypothetical protein